MSDQTQSRKNLLLGMFLGASAVNLAFYFGLSNPGVCSKIARSPCGEKPKSFTGEQFSSNKLVEAFNKLYYDSKIWEKATWLGIPLTQNPCDTGVIQEIITEVNPDYIIETGTLHGGSALFYATVLQNINKHGKVLTVDVAPLIKEAARVPLFEERIELIIGDSVSDEVVKAIAERVKGQKVIVTLDSLHTKEHVLKELQLYAPLVSVGSYIIVQDANVNGHPVFPDFGLGPMEAVKQFLINNEEFAIDKSREKFLLTFYPNGYLKRVRE